MLLICCPYCGPRAEVEFRCGGQAHIARPGPYNAVSDDAWAHYLFYRENPKGRHHELWLHTGGCRRWFNLVRDTATHRIDGVYLLGDPCPEDLL